MRRILKHAAESVLCATGFTHLARRRNRGRTIVLAYHNIVPHGQVASGDSSLHLSQSDFARQLDIISRTHEVVPLTELESHSRANRPRVAITFDDAYQGAVVAGVEELCRRGLPATIFVAPGFIGGRSFWWDAVASNAGLSAQVREQALETLAGQDAAIREWSAARGMPARTVAPHQTAATEAQLADAVVTGLISLGSHTWSHPNLTRIDPQQLNAELQRSLAWLRERFDAVAPYISYPYGLCSAQVEHAARASGYTKGFLIAGGWIETYEAFSLPRLNIPSGISSRGFSLRTAGVLS